MKTDTAIQTTSDGAIERRDDTVQRPAWTYRPNVDIFDTADEVVLIADVPGAAADGIDVTMEGDLLTIQAAVPPRSAGSGRTLVHEYGIGGFHRRFRIDETIDAAAVTAEYRDGALTVRLPRDAQSKRRRIPIST